MSTNTVSATVPSPTGEEIPWNKKQVPPAKIVGTIIGYLAMIAVSAFVLLPFFWMFLSSLKPNNEVYAIPIKWFPSVWHWENYVATGPSPI